MGGGRNSNASNLSFSEDNLEKFRSADWSMGSPAMGKRPWTPPAMEGPLPDRSVQERARFQQPLRNRRRTWIKKSEDQPPLVPPAFPRENKVRSATWPMVTPGKRRGIWTPPAVEDLSVQERARFQEPLRKRRRVLIKKSQDQLPPAVPPSLPRCDNVYMASIHHRAVQCYNAKHPGGEFDLVRPMADRSVFFRGHLWWHLNFLARCRNTNKINRFFAEVHYRSYLVDIPIVESCTIIEESLDQYRTSCGFCSKHLGILHPMGDRSFVCGNGTGHADMLNGGKPLGPLGPLGIVKLCDYLGISRLPLPPGPWTPSDPGMPSMEDANWASDEKVRGNILYTLPSPSKELGPCFRA